MNEIGVRTHVASRAGSVLGVFGAKNHRKSERRNATKFGNTLNIFFPFKVCNLLLIKYDCMILYVVDR